MRALHLDSLNADQLRELDELYRTTRDVRVRTRAQMILLVAEQRLAVSEVALIVRESGETIRRWVHRYEGEGIEGWYLRYPLSYRDIEEMLLLERGLEV